MGDLMFGAVPLNVHGTTTKVHALPAPAQVLLTKLFAINPSDVVAPGANGRYRSSSGASSPSGAGSGGSPLGASGRSRGPSSMAGAGGPSVGGVGQPPSLSSAPPTEPSSPLVGWSPAAWNRGRSSTMAAGGDTMAVFSGSAALTPATPFGEVRGRNLPSRE